MNWLQGGPYYELSFLVRNKKNKESLLDEILESLTNRVNVKIVDSSNQLNEKVDSFVKGYEDEGIIRRSIDINSEIQIEGNRKSRIFIEELSEELMKLNFWFYGSEYDAEEWNQIGIKENQKPKFRELFLYASLIEQPAYSRNSCLVLHTLRVKYSQGFCVAEHCCRYKTNLQLNH